MLIKALLHVRGSKMDLYAPSYFRQNDTTVDPFERLTGGTVYAYGKGLPDHFEPQKNYQALSGDQLIYLYLPKGLPIDPSDSISQYYSRTQEYATTNPKGDVYFHEGRAYRKLTMHYLNTKLVEWKEMSSGDTHCYYAAPGIGLYEWTGTVKPTEEDDFTTPRCINLTEYVAAGNTWDFDHELPEVYKDFLVKNAFVPPSRWWTDNTHLEPNDSLMGWWLSYYNYKTPNFWTINDTDTIKTYVSETEDEEAVKHNDVVFGLARNVTKMKNIVPIMNGLFCFPSISATSITVPDGARYILSNKEDRDRGIVLMDFTQVGGMKLYKLSELSTDSMHIMLPESYDDTKQSLLLVVDGRLFCPDEFEIIGRQIVFDRSMFKPVYDLDRKLVLGQFEYNIRQVVTDDKRDILKQRNSFLIVVNTPNMQIVRHDSFMQTRDDTRKRKHGSPSFCQMDKNQFSYYARGLMFDHATRSVHDYMREEHTQTFYALQADRITDWHVSSTTVKAQRPLVVYSRNVDNLMSARGTVFDHNFRYAKDTVVWPKYVILDFIFRG